MEQTPEVREGDPIPNVDVEQLVVVAGDGGAGTCTRQATDTQTLLGAGKAILVGTCVRIGRIGNPSVTLRY